MSTPARFSLASALIALALAPGVAGASHFTGTCGAELNAVESAILAAEFLGPTADSNRSNLLTKLAATAAKLEQDKPSDAVDKLQDISDKATDWAAAVKPKLKDATAINEQVAAAMACISS